MVIMTSFLRIEIRTTSEDARRYDNMLKITEKRVEEAEKFAVELRKQLSHEKHEAISAALEKQNHQTTAALQSQKTKFEAQIYDHMMIGPW